MEDNMRCKLCNSAVVVEYTTITLATSVSIHCTACEYTDSGGPPQRARVPMPIGSRRCERNTDYAINVLYVFGFISSGDGGREAARLMGLLGIPRDTTMESRSFPTIEQRIGPTVRKLAQDIMLENLHEEVEYLGLMMNSLIRRNLWKRCGRLLLFFDVVVGAFVFEFECYLCRVVEN